MVITVVFLLLIAGLFFGLLIIAIACAINAKTTGGRVASIVAGTTLLLIVPLVVVSLTLVGYRSVSSEPAIVTAHAQERRTGPPPVISQTVEPATSVTGDSVAAPPAIVTPEIRLPLPPSPDRVPGAWRTTGSFAADVYPSFEAAIKPLVTSLKDSLAVNRVLERDEENQSIDPKNIIITSFGSALEPLAPRLAEQIRLTFPEANVRLAGEAPPEPSDDALSIHLAIADSDFWAAPWDPDLRIERGHLSCSAHLGDRNTSVDCFVTEREWVESFDRFVSTYPKRNFVVGYSGEFQSSESEARNDAFADAARQSTIDIQGITYPVVDERHMVDRFAQKLSRSYGDVWREAVLVEVPDRGQVAAASNAASVEFRRSAFGMMSQHLGIVFLIIVIALICILLNWVTKGYYRGQVTLGLAGAIVVGFLFLALFIS